MRKHPIILSIWMRTLVTFLECSVSRNVNCDFFKRKLELLIWHHRTSFSSFSQPNVFRNTESFISKNFISGNKFSQNSLSCTMCLALVRPRYPADMNDMLPWGREWTFPRESGKKLIQIIHSGGFHWVIAVYGFYKRSFVVIDDSASLHNNHRQWEQIYCDDLVCNHVFDTVPSLMRAEFKIAWMPCQIQTGGSACGAFWLWLFGTILHRWY
jgi:hypothetical protein